MSWLGRSVKRGGGLFREAGTPPEGAVGGPVPNIGRQARGVAFNRGAGPPRLLEAEAREPPAAAPAAGGAGGRPPAAGGGGDRPPARREVRARAERAARAGDDHRAHGVVGVRRVEGVDELPERRGGDG